MTTPSYLNHLQNLIHTYTRRLQLLKEQHAMRGLNTPPEIILEIEDIEARLEQLQTELAEVQSGLELTTQSTDLTYLQEQLALYQTAQRTAPTPQRFQSKIEELETTIANWEGRVEQQQQRIATGLSEIRQETVEPEQAKKRLPVVGQRPLDVIDHFKNRVREQETIGQLLAEPTTRLVSVIGHGGMGKTALACKILQDLEQHRWPHTDEDIPLDGLVYLSTRTLGISVERLFLDCAKMLGGDQEKRLHPIWTNPKLNTSDKISYLLTALAKGQYVILLDNVEDLLDSQGQLVDQDLQLFFEQSLSQAHGARLLLTSRQALTFRREVMRFDRQVKLLAGLPVDDGDALLRELDPNGDYGLREASEEQLAEAVSLVHGVPRALEVIAGILANDPFATLDEVLASFYEQADVVQALIEKNYKRLDTEARRVIEALAVFKRPVPPLAVDYLLEPFTPGLDVPSILRRLTRTNIININRATKMVTLHPIDQDYAYSQLSEESVSEPTYTRQALERRAADYYTQLRTPEETWKSINDLEPQLIEFEHRIQAHDYDEAGQILEVLVSDYLKIWGHYRQLARMREKLLGHITDLSLQTKNLGELGNTFRVLGEYEYAIARYNDALTIARKTGDQKNEGLWLSSMGTAYRAIGQVTQSIERQEEALSISRKIDDRLLESYCLGRLADAYHNLRDFERALNLYRQALDISREIGNRAGEAINLGNIGRAYRSLGYLEEAVGFHQEAIAISREIGDRRWEGVRMGTMGGIYYELARFKEAVECYEKALTITQEIGERRGEGIWFDSLGLVYYALGEMEHAIELHKQALTIARQVNHRRGEIRRLGHLGHAYYMLGQISQASKYFKESLTIAEEIDHHSGQIQPLLGIGRILLFAGELTKAQQYCLKALTFKETSYQAVLILGFVLLHQREQAAQSTFADAITRCQLILNKTTTLYQPRYALATALVGRAVSDPQWIVENSRSELLAPALVEYEHVLKICATPGVIQDTLRDLELIRGAGVEGLEPVFTLLKAELGES